MTKNISKFLSLLVVSAVAASLLAVGGVRSVSAAGTVPSGTIAAGAKARVNNQNSGAMPLAREAKGVKVFGADATATVVTDEAGSVAANGGLASLEIGAAGSANMGQALPVCYLLVYDSSVAANTTEANSVSRLLTPPLQAGLSVVKSVEFAYPRQFNNGLVVLVGGVDAAKCRASIGWLTNGGAD